MFRATSRLSRCRITFFTRKPCGLCDAAKAVVEGLNAKRPFDYREINVMESGQEKWRDLYEFDTPVVSFGGLKAVARGIEWIEQVHIDKAETLETLPLSLKLMHRFKEEDVIGLMDKVEQS